MSNLFLLIGNVDTFLVSLFSALKRPLPTITLAVHIFVRMVLDKRLIRSLLGTKTFTVGLFVLKTNKKAPVRQLHWNQELYLLCLEAVQPVKTSR